MAATLHCQNTLSNLNTDCLSGAEQHGCSTCSRHLVCSNHSMPVLARQQHYRSSPGKAESSEHLKLLLGETNALNLQGIGMWPCQALHHTSSVGVASAAGCAA